MGLTLPLPSREPRAARILIIDDEPGICRLFAEWACSLGHTARVAQDAEIALRMLREEPADVALCDIRMPGRDGLWLIDELRRTHPTTAIVIATGIEDLHPTTTLRPGIVGYLVKPFRRSELERAIDHALLPNSPWMRNLDGGRSAREIPELEASLA